MIEHLFGEPVGVFLIIVSVILLAPLLSRFVRLPGIVGLVIGGILIGPYGLGLLQRTGIVESLATVGLIYLMFSAGAEIDLKQFNAVRLRSLVFGLLTFVFPMLIGTLLGLLLGYNSLSAVLLGSVFASHTLIAFPVITRLGLARNEAVAVTVGATIITDIGALLVLAAVARVQGGMANIYFFAQLILLMLLFTAVILWGVPRLGRLFFQRFNASATEFQFVLAVIFVAAFMAEVIGMEAIVGAFLVGIAINTAVPHQSPALHQVRFIGESLFVPVFLLSIGMLVNPMAILSDGRTLLVGGLMVLAVYSAKWLAAWFTGRLFQYSRDEIRTMWGLSQAQAAATLAATLVGVQIGLFDEAIFSGAIMMILFTCITSPLLVERFAPRLKAAA